MRQFAEQKLEVIQKAEIFLRQTRRMFGEPGTLPRGIINAYDMPRWQGFMPAILQTVNAHRVTFELAESKARRSEPIEKLMLSWADEKNCLLVLVKL